MGPLAGLVFIHVLLYNDAVIYQIVIRYKKIELKRFNCPDVKSQLFWSAVQFYLWCWSKNKLYILLE